MSAKERTNNVSALTVRNFYACLGREANIQAWRRLTNRLCVGLKRPLDMAHTVCLLKAAADAGAIPIQGLPLEEVLRNQQVFKALVEFALGDESRLRQIWSDTDLGSLQDRMADDLEDKRRRNVTYVIHHGRKASEFPDSLRYGNQPSGEITIHPANVENWQKLARGLAPKLGGTMAPDAAFTLFTDAMADHVIDALGDEWFGSVYTKITVWILGDYVDYILGPECREQLLDPNVWQE